MFQDVLVLWPQWILILILVAVHCFITFFLPVEKECPIAYLDPPGLHLDNKYLGLCGRSGRLHRYAYPVCWAHLQQAYLSRSLPVRSLRSRGYFGYVKMDYMIAYLSSVPITKRSIFCLKKQNNTRFSRSTISLVILGSNRSFHQTQKLESQFPFLYLRHCS